ncbi:MAG: CDP-glycerol glycerophosphotransferase family protein, partial [Microbacterium sp.]|nr:CDP-glycerol glycerophosphotransferase family protein [Microbacterium sp.]
SSPAHSPADRRATARAAIAAATGPFDPATRIVLYAPTWRDGEQDPAIPDAHDWAALTEILRREDALLLVRSHPLGAGEYLPPAPTDRVRSLGSGLVPDVTPLLPGIDVLITDYSSLIFDSALVPVPVVYLAPDAEDYSRTRGFYGSYEDVAESGWARDWASAIPRLAAVLGDAEDHQRRIEHARAVSSRVHEFRDGRNTERVYRAILSRLGRARRDLRPEGMS